MAELSQIGSTAHILLTVAAHLQTQVSWESPLRHEGSRAKGQLTLYLYRFESPPLPVMGHCICSWSKGLSGAFSGCTMKKLDLALHTASSIFRGPAQVHVYSRLRRTWEPYCALSTRESGVGSHPAFESHFTSRPLPHLHIRRNSRIVKSKGASGNIQAKAQTEKILWVSQWLGLWFLCSLQLGKTSESHCPPGTDATAERKTVMMTTRMTENGWEGFSLTQENTSWRQQQFDCGENS